MDKDEIAAGCIALALFIAVFVGLIWLAVYLDKQSCAAKWAGTAETRYPDIVTGCQVRIKGKWYPEDRVRTVND